MDGAGPWRQFVDITLPLLRPIIALVLLLRGIDAFKEFDKVFIMTGGGPGTVSELQAIYAYRVNFQELEPRLWSGGLVHGLPRRSGPLFDFLQGRVLEILGERDLGCNEQAHQDRRNGRPCLRAGDRARTPTCGCS